MRKSDLTSPTLLGFLWANRRHFAPGMGFALARIVSIAPFPVIFEGILNRHMPAKNIGGILTLSLVMMLLLGAHQWLIVRGATRPGKTITSSILRLRAQIFHKIQCLSFGFLDG